MGGDSQIKKDTTSRKNHFELKKAKEVINGTLIVHSVQRPMCARIHNSLKKNGISHIQWLPIDMN